MAKKKSASLGCLFWIAFILLVIVLFFFNRKNIAETLDKTGAARLFSGGKVTVKNEDGTVTPQIKPSADAELLPGDKSAPGDGSAETLAPEGAAKTTEKQPPVEATKPAGTEPTPEKPVQPQPAQPATTVQPAASTTTTTQKPVTQKTAVPVAKPAQTVKPSPTRTVQLFFVTIDADGRVVRKEVAREIAQTDSPLSETLNTLFKGPTTTETNRGLRSLVPQGTRLLSAYVKDGIATINLSEEFQFNQFGIEGYLGQLAQVVFTATSWPTVKSVQILIDGQRKEYLGAEGVWIGTPLSRDKF
jgi:spore germination protein GerM